MTNTGKFLNTSKIFAIFLMIAGQSWAAGNFTPSGAPFINPLLHCIPIVLIFAFALPLLRWRSKTTSEEEGPRWATIAMNIFAVITIIGVAFLIVLGQTSTDPNAVGVKTLEDWFPAVILLAGAILWLVLQLPLGQHQAVVSTASNK